MLTGIDFDLSRHITLTTVVFGNGAMNALASRLRLSCKPALLHLGISASIALIAIGLTFLAWYPGALAGAQGVSQLVLILIAVDVVIGPLITLIVFVPGKASLRFDLAAIAAIQTVALLYGMQAIYGGRPAYLVFNVDRFDAVPVQEVSRESLSRAPEEFRLSPFGPKILAARMPTDSEKRNDILFSSVGGGADLPQLPEYFVRLDEERDNMLKRLRPLDDLRKLNELDDLSWKALLNEFGKPEADLGYLPMVANARDGAVILDAKTGEVLGIRLLTPSFARPSMPETPPSSTPAPAPGPAPSKSPTAPAASQGLG